ncbi:MULTISPECIES: multidrug effflux MFS transporter [unclassified Siphonobacter]|uniref:multidrug effflux MFS transporter n=1 Tax=unclassified Siphonobacter TaxID=2635712 RepID=UPI000CB7A180|nr:MULTISPECIES: multidrug effflux MFS transporter [unclassified Siphonobacter]MDQ1090213.1 DHA1 family bicyclomycin/chloramphenicol resistance-like MFS transporter [Siphonobacter sp. SORGH_AS_1065]PKK37147.1 Bcr/CflA family drug resistance efflux transporter [Siphonobacter sp. SORGH_AS_0500]
MKQKQGLIITLGLLTAVAPFSIDTYLPAFTVISRDLQTDISYVAYSLTSFFIGISLGQALCGPLLDRFGRKKPLLIGLSLYVLAAIACASVQSVNWLIAIRFLLALGGCVGMVASRAVVRDLFTPQEMAGVLSTLMLIMGVSPIIAPTIGGYISEVAGWRYIFGFLALVGVTLIMLVLRYLPESKPADPSISLKPARILKDYGTVLKEPIFSIHSLVAGMASGSMFSYIAGSPFVFMKLHNLSQTEYGWAFGFNACGMILGSQVNRFWLKRAKSEEILKKISAFQWITALLLIMGTVLNLFNAMGLLSIMFIYLFFHGFISPNAAATALFPFKRYAGSASALLGCIQMLIGAAASGLVSYFHNGTALPMVVGMALSSTLGYFLLISPKLARRNLQPVSGS